MVPFVAKIMESCSKSRVFKPPCPWVMAIMSLLVELHQVPDLKVIGKTTFSVKIQRNTLL